MKNKREEARKLRKDGHTLPHIVRLVGSPKTTVYNWIQDIPFSARQNRGESQKESWRRRKEEHNKRCLALPCNAVSLQGHTKTKGDVAELLVMARVVQRGYTVLCPYGDNARYDFVFESEGGFSKVQCKIGHLRSGRIEFPTKNNKGNYKGQVDFFGVYCPELDKCYLVPIDVVWASSKMPLYVVEPLHKVKGKTCMAGDYEL